MFSSSRCVLALLLLQFSVRRALHVLAPFFFALLMLHYHLLQFVMLASFDHTNPTLPVEERMAVALRRSGVSITCECCLPYIHTQLSRGVEVGAPVPVTVLASPREQDKNVHVSVMIARGCSALAQERAWVIWPLVVAVSYTHLTLPTICSV